MCPRLTATHRIPRTGRRSVCGRYAISTSIDVVAEVLSATLEPGLTPGLFQPRYNVAPTQQAPVVRVHDSRRVISLLRWGLVPSWAKDPTIGNRMINARLESVADKPAFRNALRRRRCIVVADGFYEWQKLGEGSRAPKQPWFIHADDGALLPMAGLWETWRSSDGELIESFTILTTDANDLMRPLHDRMPVILPREACDRWLDARLDDGDAAVSLLQAAMPPRLTTRKVSTHVNTPQHDDPRCCEAVE